jgi:site-specific DNA-methyltransferase (adenine-specific)
MINRPISDVKLMDCMEGLKSYPDKFFDLAIVDPPYGIGEDGKSNHSRGTKGIPPTMFKPKEWDKKPPDRKYFYELFRVSKNQIIWGANHFISKIPVNSSCWIVWDKDNSTSDFADCELAWTSFRSAVRKYVFRWHGMLQGNMKQKQIRIHPTQKPIQLYEWLLNNYAKQGDKILDTHLGSGSSRIVAYKLGFDFWGFEIDEDYFKDAEKRFKESIAMPLFDNLEPTQLSIL